MLVAGLTLVISFSGPRQAETAFETDLRQCLAYTLRSRRGLEFLHQAVKTLNRFQIDGDLVDSGVWKGGTSMLLALAEQRYAYGGPQRGLWLLDNTDPLGRPGVEDGAAALAIDPLVQQHGATGNATVQAARRRVEADERTDTVQNRKWANPGRLLEVRANMLSTGYPPDKVHFVRGPVVEANTENDPDAPMLPERIALFRLDTESYKSTKAGLDVLWPLMVKGGLMVADDYGRWGAGAAQAIDEWLQSTEGRRWQPTVLNATRKGNRSLSAVWYVRNLSSR